MLDRVVPRGGDENRDAIQGEMLILLSSSVFRCFLVCKSKRKESRLPGEGRWTKATLLASGETMVL
ncbi:MAG: hypothetical protein WD491_00060 [Balneolales bacterium]